MKLTPEVDQETSGGHFIYIPSCWIGGVFVWWIRTILPQFSFHLLYICLMAVLRWHIPL